MSAAIMKPYFYTAEITAELLRHILLNGAGFQAVMQASVAAFGGRLVRCHLTAAGGEPIGFLEFPSDIEARAWNAYYLCQEGVRRSSIKKMLDEDDLSEINSLLMLHAPKGIIHRA
jgi:hypothetical protein